MPGLLALAATAAVPFFTGCVAVGAVSAVIAKRNAWRSSVGA